jgi:oxygen-independent coproporphyrinogen-3 oxidase
VRTPDRYVELVERGESVEAAGEDLDDATREFERRQLLLRTREGVERSVFDEATLADLADLVVAHPDDPSRVVLTRRGRLMANEISLRFRP